jgi:hypothetical protein
MTSNLITPYLALLQGTFVVGLTFNIILFHLKSKPLNFTTLQVIMMALSYVLITVATLITVSTLQMDDAWYMLVGAGYLLGDIGLISIYGNKRSKVIQQRYFERMREILGKHYEFS